jgi:hypothetical protein
MSPPLFTKLTPALEASAAKPALAAVFSMSPQEKSNLIDASPFWQIQLRLAR